jgi:hypothetical protein
MIFLTDGVGKPVVECRGFVRIGCNPRPRNRKYSNPVIEVYHRACRRFLGRPCK